MKPKLMFLIGIAIVAISCNVLFFAANETSLEGYADDTTESLPASSLSDEGSAEKTIETRDRNEAMLSEEPIPEPMDADSADGMLFGDIEAELVEDSAVAGSFIAEEQVNTTLKAGEIDDNDEWDEYLLYRRESLDNFGDWVNDVDVSGRQIITVTDAQGLPVLGATVSIFADSTLVSQTRTYANGQTLFFPNANPDSQDVDEFAVTIEVAGQSQSFEMNLLRSGPRWDFALDMRQSRESVKLDIVFLLDATGSMSDEIGQLQDNLLVISQQIDNMGDVDVRYGLVHYRDRDDAYVTQVHEFTPDVKAFQRDLDSVVADGGGDTPESLNAGLHDALHEVEWRGDDTIKLVFLVADAPPHLDYANDYDYAEEMLFAAERGIKIHPIASSGLDAVGEYIFRQIGQTTMGHFIFLTYAGGTPGTPGEDRPDLAAGEQDYTVDFLDGLVVRLIEDEINAFKGELTQS